MFAATMSIFHTLHSAKNTVRNTPPKPTAGAASTNRMEDVALEAQVALVTVSRAINHPSQLAPKTLEKVQAAIQKLGYVPNLTAGSLASAKTRIIAAVVPTISNSFFSETIEALANTLDQHGYQLLLGQTFYREANETKIVEAFLGRRVDGIVLTGIHHEKTLVERLKASGIPVVEMWEHGPHPIDMLVGFSNFDAGRAAARFLIARGYRQLGYLGGYEYRSQQRLQGLRQEARQYANVSVHSIETTSPSPIENGVASLLELKKQAPGLDAVFCSNDMLAASAIYECARQNWKVPGDIAIMGFADLPIASACHPRLTTIRVHRRAMGESTARLLLDRLQGRPIASMAQDLGFDVIERESA